MGYYPSDKNQEINQMWIHVRCFNLNSLPRTVRYGLLVLVILVVALLVGSGIRYWHTSKSK